MPIGEKIMDHIKKQNTNINDLVLGTIQLCETLEKLHEKNISHRDIKPSNIYFYNNRYYFGDFGLVEFPDNQNNLTRSDRGLGAIFTIAPEMKRNPKKADGKKADVYSLAKTMWMLLTKDEKGFDGVYNFLDHSHGLHFMDTCKDIYKNEHLVEIEELLQDSTNNNPDLRPTIKEFKERLQIWIEISTDKNKSQASDWKFLNKHIFGLYPPDSSSWKDIDKIIGILNVIANIPAYNHMFFHTGGGLDLSCVIKAQEDNCIKLYDTGGFCHLLKPQKLYFEGFDENFRWNYFLLELDELDCIIADNEFDCEYLVEDFPGHYVSAQYADYGVYDYDIGNSLPENFEKVHRYTRGRLLIVMKYGPYNRISATYDGRHGDCTIYEFRQYMDKLLYCYLKYKNKIKQRGLLSDISEEKIEKRILKQDCFSENPFKKDLMNTNYLEIKKEIKNEEKSKEYIVENFLKWDFCDILSQFTVSNQTNTKFIFEFSKLLDDSIFSLLNNDHYYLCKDGYIKKMNSCYEKECFSIFDRDLAITIKNMLIDRINGILNQNGLKELEKHEIQFSIILIKNGNPKHLFTKKEIEDAMKDADDRVSNQLVIDENGYAKVIKDEGYGHLYPVSHEVWSAGNIYVGKYSNLLTLEDNYISSLQGWLLYLNDGTSQYMEYVLDDRNIEELLKRIKKFYK